MSIVLPSSLMEPLCYDITTKHTGLQPAVSEASLSAEESCYFGSTCILAN